jgi:membrane-associated protein
MPLLPGDSLLFSVGLLAAASGQLALSTVIPMLIIAALLGDQLNYFLGRYFSSWIQEREQILFLKRSHIEQTEAFYAKYGSKMVILARFVPIVRTVAPFVAGAGRMSYPVYLLYGFLGATFWVTSISLAGFYLGDNVFVKENFEKVVLGIVFVSVLPILLGAIKQIFSRK